MTGSGLKIFFSLLQIMALVFISSYASSQSASEMKKIFARAESYFLYGEYELANPLYIMLETPENKNIKYKIGVCYLNIPGEKEKSVPYLEEAVKNADYNSKEAAFREKRAPLDAYFYLAKAYMTDNQLEKGLNTFQTFRRLADESRGGIENFDFIDQQIQACNNAISFSKNPVFFSKRMLGNAFSQGSINENPAISFDGNTLVYTERRGIINTIWWSKKMKGAWQEPVEITAQLNAGDDCSTCSLNYDGTELFLYKTDTYDGSIYSSTFRDGVWGSVEKLNRNINTRFYESHAAISPDGRSLYFTSNREGGYGKLDIYVSKRDLQGDWGPAKNLGSAINTPFNEDTPFLTLNDSLLYFSSEGHSSMGGFDNYKAARADSSWQAPVNLGYPINSTDDDKFLQPANNGLNGFCSLETDYKKKDIFYLSFNEYNIDLKGVVNLSDTVLIFDEFYKVSITDKETGKILGAVTPEPYSGAYSFNIKPGNYRLTFTGTGYLSQDIDTIIPPGFPDYEVKFDVTLRRDLSAARPKKKIYEKINFDNIPTVDNVDSALLAKNMNVNDVTDVIAGEEVLFYTVQVIALYNPVDISYFRHINNIRIIYNEKDKFFRYTTGEYATKEEANRRKLELISKGYPTDLWVKKVTSRQIP